MNDPNWYFPSAHFSQVNLARYSKRRVNDTDRCWRASWKESSQGKKRRKERGSGILVGQCLVGRVHRRELALRRKSYQQRPAQLLRPGPSSFIINLSTTVQFTNSKSGFLKGCIRQVFYIHTCPFSRSIVRLLAALPTYTSRASSSTPTMFTSSLPMLPPPPSSLLPSLNQPNIAVSQPQPQHPQRRPKPPPPSTNTPLALLALDERVIAQRKMAIAMYGWSWLKPAGCAKTMLGRKEEEVEREEVERQLREVELQERVQFEMEEAERRRIFEAQTRAEAASEAPGEQERDLDDEVPEAEAEEDEEEDGEEEDLDDDIPEGYGPDWHYDTRLSPEPGEGETGITDEVERSHLGDGLQIPPIFHAGIFANQPTAEQMAYADEQAIANAMQEDDEIEGAGERDLDDEVPDADMDVDEDGWEHTDTELEESEMDISILPQQQAQYQQPTQAVTRSQRAATPATVESSIAETGRRSWLGGSPRSNLFGRTNYNPGIAGSLFTPPPATPQSPAMDSEGEDSMRARRIARAPRRGANITPGVRENRDSLD